MKDTLGDRMKSYEDVFRTHLSNHLPVIIRLDGKSFHSYTKGCDKPFDFNIERLMNETTLALCEQVQSIQVAYTQSDEISLLLHSYKNQDSQAWFGNNIQKMVSVAASIATAAFNKAVHCFEIDKLINKGPALFDARCFILPECEVVNYFIWRQQDATRNSIQMLAQSLYSQKELHGKKSNQLQEMTFQKGHNWNELSTQRKRGRCAVKQQQIFGVDNGGVWYNKREDAVVVRNKWAIDNEIPIFTQDRNYIHKYLLVEEK